MNRAAAGLAIELRRDPLDTSNHTAGEIAVAEARDDVIGDDDRRRRIRQPVAETIADGNAHLPVVRRDDQQVAVDQRMLDDRPSRQLAAPELLPDVLAPDRLLRRRVDGVQIAERPNEQLVGAPANYHQKTLIAQLADAVFHDFPVALFLIAGVTALILVLAANTAFNGFPVLASILSRDGNMPRQLHNRGDRLAFSNGILLLAGFAILLIVLLVSMAITALYGWTVERIAYRPLRHSFRLAPMLSAIGMSFVLTNYSQVAQGARVKPVPPIVTGGYTLHEGAGGFAVQLSNIQIIVVVTTVVLLALFTWLVARTRLGRDMRACEQDQTMAALLGVDVDRTISMTFVIGAALAAVAGMMYLLYYGQVDFFMGFVAGIKAFTAAVLGGIGSLAGAMLGGLLIGLIEVFWAGYFSSEYKDVAVFGILVLVLIFRPTGLLGKPEIEKV